MITYNAIGKIEYYRNNKRVGEGMSLSFRQWREMALLEYPVVSDRYYKKVYENIVVDPQTGESTLVQLTLQGVLDKCEGTNYEEIIKKSIMKCVYTGCRLEKEINKVMNQYYEV